MKKTLANFKTNTRFNVLVGFLMLLIVVQVIVLLMSEAPKPGAEISASSQNY